MSTIEKNKISIASDNAGYRLKSAIIKYLEENNIECIDCGTYNEDRCDYPDYAVKCCKKITSGEANIGILCCGTGIGMSIAANKVKGIRAACCSDTFSAKYTRLHNDANVLCVGQRVLGEGLALEIVKAFLSAEFEGGRHAKRVALISAIENEN